MGSLHQILALPAVPAAQEPHKRKATPDAPNDCSKPRFLRPVTGLVVVWYLAMIKTSWK